MSEVVSKDDWMVKLLECPICCNVPRDLPIPQCPSGHIICNKCKGSVSNCPTCDIKMDVDGTSSLAASLIEKVPHRCKFAKFGCEVKDLLSRLKKHEEKCEERTIVCPLKRCKAEVQLKNYKEHAKENCCIQIDSDGIETTISTGFLQWDGASKITGNEFDLEVELSPSLVQSKNEVYRFTRYIPHLKTLVLAVIMAKDPLEVEKYSAKITIYKDTNYKVTFDCPLIPIEQFPTEEELPNHDKCWNVHYSFLRKFLRVEDKGEKNNHNWKVKLCWSLDVTKKEE